MPSYIYNTVKFKKEDREKFTKYMKGNNFDFNKIIPMPKEFSKMGGDHGEVEEIAKEWKEFTKNVNEINASNVDKYIKKFRNEVRNNPEKYPESAKSVNLKTKKNEWGEISVPNFQYQMYRIAGEVKYGFSSWYDWCIENWGTKWNAKKTDLDEYLSFKTAWSIPLPIFRKIAELNPDTWFQVGYSDDFDENSGIIEYKPKYFTSENGEDNMAVVKYGTAGLDIVETGFFENLFEEAPERFNAVIETSEHGTFVFCN